MRTQPHAGFPHQMEMHCAGFHDGVSGSPWVIGDDPARRTGTVVGAIGGHNGGGSAPWENVSPFFGRSVLSLSAAAVAGRAPGLAPARWQG